ARVLRIRDQLTGSGRQGDVDLRQRDVDVVVAEGDLDLPVRAVRDVVQDVVGDALLLFLHRGRRREGRGSPQQGGDENPDARHHSLLAAAGFEAANRYFTSMNGPAR